MFSNFFSCSIVAIIIAFAIFLGWGAGYNNGADRARLALCFNAASEGIKLKDCAGIKP